MNFACLTAIAPGNTLAQQCQAIAAAGCTGVETLLFPDMPLEAWVGEMAQATGNCGLMPAVVILGQLALYRPGQRPWIQEALSAIVELNAAVLITPEYRAQDPLPLFPPYSRPSATEQRHVAQSLLEIVETATQVGVTVLLEPLTQFEGRFWRTAADAIGACEPLLERGYAERVGIVLDFHNMNITEVDLTATIGQSARWIKHVHLADSNRLLPGAGHIDFARVVHALAAAEYHGWCSFECAVEGDFITQVSKTITWLEALCATA